MDYSTLKTTIEGYLHRSSSEVVALIPTFVSLAESRINKDLRVPEMITRATLSMSSGDRYVTLPSDFREMFNVQIDKTSGRKALLPMTQLQMDVEHATVTTNEPNNYSILGDQMEIQPTVGATTTLEIVYLYRLAKMSGDTDTNDLITNHPNLYIYATMIEASPWVQADERMPLWSKMYGEYRDSLNEEFDDREWSGGPLQVMKLGVSTP